MAEWIAREYIMRFESNAKSTGLVGTVVRELVRCKECKYNDGGFCDEVMDGKGVDDDWFCYCGEHGGYHDEKGT